MLSREVPQYVVDGIGEEGSSVVRGTLDALHLDSLKACGIVTLYRFLEEKIGIITLSYLPARNGDPESLSINCFGGMKMFSEHFWDKDFPNIHSYLVDNNLVTPEEELEIVYVGINRYLAEGSKH